MNTDMTNINLSRISRVALLLSILSTSLIAPQIGYAQDAEPTSPLTPKYLIGSAVSLSNRSYPEIEKAIQRFSNSDVAGAQEYLKKAKEKYPKLPPTDILMAKMQVLARNTRAVRFLLDRATTQHPEDPEAYLLLADQAFSSQRTPEALALFEYAAPLIEKFSANAKRKRNFNIQLLAGRAAVAQRRSQWEAANRLLRQWVDLDPENVAAHTRMGVVLFRLDKPEEALVEFSKAREINPNSPHPDVSLGQLFSANDKLDMARKSFEKAYSEDKSDTKVAQAYVEWLIQQGELEQAQAITAALREQSPDSTTALLLDGIVAYMQGQSDRAEQALQKVLSLEPRNARATDLLALLLIQSDDVADKERALQYAQLNSERFPKSSLANVTKAWVLYELGRKAEANKTLQQAGNMKPQADSVFLIAKIFAGEGKNDQAIQALEQIVAQKKTGLVIFRREAEELLNQLKSGSDSK